MMIPHTQPEQTWLVLQGAAADGFDAAWFAAIFGALDRLHDRLSAGAALPLPREQLVGWLDEIIYTAQQIRVEVRAASPDAGITNAQSSANN